MRGKLEHDFFGIGAVLIIIFCCWFWYKFGAGSSGDLLESVTLWLCSCSWGKGVELSRCCEFPSFWIRFWVVSLLSLASVSCAFWFSFASCHWFLTMWGDSFCAVADAILCLWSQRGVKRSNFGSVAVWFNNYCGLTKPCHRQRSCLLQLFWWLTNLSQASSVVSKRMIAAWYFNCMHRFSFFWRHFFLADNFMRCFWGVLWLMSMYLLRCFYEGVSWIHLMH
jgi:hypothetical protein